MVLGAIFRRRKRVNTVKNKSMSPNNKELLLYDQIHFRQKISRSPVKNGEDYDSEASMFDKESLWTPPAEEKPTKDKQEDELNETSTTVSTVHTGDLQPPETLCSEIVHRTVEDDNKTMVNESEYVIFQDESNVNVELSLSEEPISCYDKYSSCSTHFCYWITANLQMAVETASLYSIIVANNIQTIFSGVAKDSTKYVEVAEGIVSNVISEINAYDYEGTFKEIEKQCVECIESLEADAVLLFADSFATTASKTHGEDEEEHHQVVSRSNNHEKEKSSDMLENNDPFFDALFKPLPVVPKDIRSNVQKTSSQSAVVQKIPDVVKNFVKGSQDTSLIWFNKKCTTNNGMPIILCLKIRTNKMDANKVNGQLVWKVLSSENERQTVFRLNVLDIVTITRGTLDRYLSMKYNLHDDSTFSMITNKGDIHLFRAGSEAVRDSVVSGLNAWNAHFVSQVLVGVHRV